MGHAAVPGENFARLEALPRRKMFRHAAVTAGERLEVPPLGRLGQMKQTTGAAVGLHNAAL